MSQPIPSRMEEECPYCGVLLDVGSEPLFSVVRCPNCRSEVRIRKEFGQFLLLDVLGQGGSGRVFRSSSPELQYEVALKVLEKRHVDFEENILLLRNEATCARLIDHPRIVKVIAYEEHEEGASLALELMEGGSLHDMIDAHQLLGEEQVLTIGLGIVKALEAALSKGIVHRDIKPANILFDSEGRVKLGDFGLARTNNSEAVPEMHLHATPDYVAPEILRDRLGDHCSDIYSLGGCIYHVVIGEPPYTKTDGRSLDELLLLKAQPVMITRKGISPSLQKLIKRMMDPDPLKRFSSYAELEQAIISSLEVIGRTSLGSHLGRKRRRKEPSVFQKFLSWIKKLDSGK